MSSSLQPPHETGRRLGEGVDRRRARRRTRPSRVVQRLVQSGDVELGEVPAGIGGRLWQVRGPGRRRHPEGSAAGWPPARGHPRHGGVRRPWRRRRRYRDRDDAGGRPRPGDALPRPGPRHGLPGQGVPAGPRRRAQHRPGRDRRAGGRRDAEEARRHRRLQRQGDLRGPGGRGAALPRPARGDDAGADHAGRRALPRRAAGRLPPALDVERRRGRDRGDGGDGDRPRATSTWS